MRIFVVSDTHGDLKNAIELYDRATENGPVDFIIHCGDFYSDGVRLAQVLGQRVYAVHGNCDGGWGEEFKIVETPAGRIIVIHGHNEDVDFSLDNAVYLAQREKCSAVCYGHTHKADINTVISPYHLSVDAAVKLYRSLIFDSYLFDSRSV